MNGKIKSNSPMHQRLLPLLLSVSVMSCIPDLEPRHNFSVGVGVTIGGVARTESAMASLSTAVSMANPSVEIVVGFVDSSTTFVRLAKTTVVRDTADQRVALDVDIAPCLAGAPENIGCALTVSVRLLDGAGAAYDSAKVGPLNAAKPGTTVEVPAIHFRPTAELRPVDTLMTVKVAQKLPARVNVYDAGGQLLAGRSMVWRSLNPAIAAIDVNGTVTGIVTGRTTIEASREGKTTTFALVVPIVESFVVSTPTVRVIATVPAQMNVTITTAPGFGTSVTYRSNNSAVATVDGTGRITTFTGGSATITAIALADTNARVNLALTVDPYRAVTTIQRIVTGDLGPLPDHVAAMWGTRSDSLVAVACSAISRYDGSTWKFDFKPTFCPQAVTGTSMKSIWAFGSQIWFYNGTGWARETVPQTGSIYSATTVDGVTFAVGTSGQILRRDAAGWQTMASGTTRHLYSVSAVSPTEVYVAGDSGTVLRLQNGQWVPMVSTNFRAIAMHARSINEIYFTGATLDTGFVRYRRYNGSAWVNLSVADGCGYLAFVPVGTDVFLTGCNNAILKLVNGNFVNDASYVAETTFRAGFGDAFGIVLAGNYGVSAVKRSGAWTPINHSPSYQGVWAASPSFIVAGGIRGSIDMFDGTSWRAMRGESGQAIYSMWGSDPQNIWAVGSAGTIARYQGAGWTSVSSGTTAGLRAVWGTARDNAWIVTEGGAILRFNGNTWQTALQTTASLLGISGANERTVYAVGGGGKIWRFDGQSWTSEASGTTLNLWGVYVADSANVFAVGDTVMLQRQNGAWRNVTPPSKGYFRFVVGSGPKDVYAGGYCAQLHRFDGNAWAVSDPTFAANCAWNGVIFPNGGGVFVGYFRSVAIGTGPLGNTPGLPK